jgi:hypothetical protein
MSGIRITADENGCPIVLMNDVKDFSISGLGSITGTGAVVLGANENDASLYDFYNVQDAELEFIASNNESAYSFNGDNISATLGMKNDTVTWNVTNGYLNTRGGNDIVSTTANSAKNEILLGKGNDYLEDSGTANTISSEDKSIVWLKEASKAASVSTGDREDLVLVEGDNAVIKTNNGDDKVITSATSSNNMIDLGKGYNTAEDSGSSNVISSPGKAAIWLKEISNGATVYTGDYADKVLAEGTGAAILTSGGDDEIVYNNNSYINSGSGNDFISQISLLPESMKTSWREFFKSIFG